MKKTKILLPLSIVGLICSMSSCSCSPEKDPPVDPPIDPIDDVETCSEDDEVCIATSGAGSISPDPKYIFYLKEGEERTIKANTKSTQEIEQKKYTWKNLSEENISVVEDVKSDGTNINAKFKGLKETEPGSPARVSVVNNYTESLKFTFNVNVINFDDDNMYLWQYDSSARKEFGYINEKGKTAGVKTGIANLGNMAWDFTRSEANSLNSGNGGIGFGKKAAPENVTLVNKNTRKVKEIVIEAGSTNSLNKISVSVGDKVFADHVTLPKPYHSELSVFRYDCQNAAGDITLSFIAPEYHGEELESNQMPGATYLKSILIKFEEENITSINVASDSQHKYLYLSNEDFSTEGLKLTKTTASGRILDVPLTDPNLTITPPDIHAPSHEEKEVKISYTVGENELTTSYKIRVRDAEWKISKIGVQGQLAAASLLAGDPIDYSGVKLIAYYEDDNDFDVLPFNQLHDGFNFTRNLDDSKEVFYAEADMNAGYTVNIAYGEATAALVVPAATLNVTDANFERIDLIKAKEFLKLSTTAAAKSIEGKNINVNFDHLKKDDSVVPLFNNNIYIDVTNPNLVIKDVRFEFKSNGKNYTKYNILASQFSSKYCEETSYGEVNQETGIAEHLGFEGKQVGIDLKPTAGNPSYMYISSILVRFNEEAHVNYSLQFAEGGNIPTKVAYRDVDEFNPEGLHIIAKADNDEFAPIEVTERMEFFDGSSYPEKNKVLSPASTSVIGELSGKTIEVSGISVYALDSYRIEGELEKKVYCEGSNFKKTGITIFGFVNGHPELEEFDITSKVSFSTRNLNIGETYFEGTYNKDAETGIAQITVKVEGISVLPFGNLTPVKNEKFTSIYKKGAKFSTTGLSISGTSPIDESEGTVSASKFVWYDGQAYDDENFEEIEDNQYLRYGSTSVVGIRHLEGISEPQVVRVNDINVVDVESIEVVKDSEVFTEGYLVGQAFDKAGLTVYKHYTDDLLPKEEVKSNLYYYTSETVDSKKPDNKITKTGEVEIIPTFKPDGSKSDRIIKGEVIKVTGYPIDHIELDAESTPVKDYLRFDSFNKEGTKVLAYAQDPSKTKPMDVTSKVSFYVDGKVTETKDKEDETKIKVSGTPEFDTQTTKVVGYYKDVEGYAHPEYNIIEIDGLNVSEIDHIKYTFKVDEEGNPTYNKIYAEGQKFSPTNIVVLGYNADESLSNRGTIGSKVKWYDSQDKNTIELNEGSTFVEGRLLKQDETGEITVTDTENILVSVYRFVNYEIEFVDGDKSVNDVKYHTYIEGDTFKPDGIKLYGIVDADSGMEKVNLTSLVKWYTDDSIEAGSSSNKMTLETTNIIGKYRKLTIDLGEETGSGFSAVPIDHLQSEQDPEKFTNKVLLNGEYKGTGLKVYAVGSDESVKPMDVTSKVKWYSSYTDEETNSKVFTETGEQTATGVYKFEYDVDAFDTYTIEQQVVVEGPIKLEFKEFTNTWKSPVLAEGKDFSGAGTKFYLYFAGDPNPIEINGTDSKMKWYDGPSYDHGNLTEKVTAGSTYFQVVYQGIDQPVTFSKENIPGFEGLVVLPITHLGITLTAGKTATTDYLVGTKFTNTNLNIKGFTDDPDDTGASISKTAKDAEGNALVHWYDGVKYDAGEKVEELSEGTTYIVVEYTSFDAEGNPHYITGKFDGITVSDYSTLSIEGSYKTSYSTEDKFDPTGITFKLATENGKFLSKALTTEQKANIKFYDGPSYDADEQVLTESLSEGSTYVYAVYDNNGKECIKKIEGLEVKTTTANFERALANDDLVSGAKYILLTVDNEIIYAFDGSSSAAQPTCIDVSTSFTDLKNNVETSGSMSNYVCTLEIVEGEDGQNSYQFKLNNAAEAYMGLTGSDAFSCNPKYVTNTLASIQITSGDAIISFTKADGETITYLRLGTKSGAPIFNVGTKASSIILYRLVEAEE